MKPTTHHLRILGTGRYVPPHEMTNKEFETLVETTDEWIVSHTGIKTRYIAKDEVTSDLATKAAQAALTKSGVSLEEIDLIVVASITGEVTTPSMANLVQAKLGIAKRPIMCFDVNAACTGFIYGLQIASALLQTHDFRKAIVIGVESLSTVCDYTDRNTCILFGDGAGAVVVEKGDQQSPSYFFTASEGDTDETLTVDRYIHMKGQKVYRFAVNVVESSIQKALLDTGLAWTDLTKIIPHQANIRIIASVANSMGIPLDMFYTNLEKYGNTSAASIPLALDEFLETNQTKPGDKLLFVGFGGGLTWGSAIITL